MLSMCAADEVLFTFSDSRGSYTTDTNSTHTCPIFHMYNRAKSHSCDELSDAYCEGAVQLIIFVQIDYVFSQE